MSFVHGKDTEVYVAQYDLSAYFTNADESSDQASHETTTFGKDTVTREAGLRDGKVSLTGLYDATADALWASWLGSASGEALTVCPGGDSAGGQARVGKIRHVSYKASQPVGGMVAVSLSLECHGVWEPNGKVVHVLGAETSTGEEATVHDVAAATTDGGAATIHCTTVSGTTPTLDSKIQHSINDSDWVDLSPAFTQLAAAGSQVIEVAAGTTVNEYIREYHTIGGSDTPTFTYLVAFARR